MFLEPTVSGYDSSGAQVTRRAKFLLLLQPDTPEGHKAPIRAVVRRVALRQCGNFMMGRANLSGRWVTVSGAYGSDGLPKTVPYADYMRGVQIPQYLYEAWNTGGGWNGAGSEAKVMREWARDNLQSLEG